MYFTNLTSLLRNKTKLFLSLFSFLLVSSAFAQPCLISNFNVMAGNCQQATNTFIIDGTVTFDNSPATGYLVVEVESASNFYYDSIQFPFTDNVAQPFLINDIPANGSLVTVAAYFSDELSCAANTSLTAPVSCGCNVSVGTFTQYSNATFWGDTLVFYYGDTLTINSNNDYVSPTEVVGSPMTYDPGIGWLVYNCLPTILPNIDLFTDPCLLGLLMYDPLNLVNDGTPVLGLNQVSFLAPVTVYSMVNNTFSYTGSSSNCYDLGVAIPVLFLDSISAISQMNIPNGVLNTTISGGLAAYNNSQFTISNVLPVSATPSSLMISNNQTFELQGLNEGESYSFTITDAAGYEKVISGVFESATSTATCSLFFSEYIEGTSSNKAVEIFNPMNNSVDLSDYKIYRYNNGSMIPTDSLFLHGILASGDVYVMGNASADQIILNESDTLHTITFYNGDDALSLVEISSGLELDIIGIVGNDPGLNWPVGAGATSEYTLIRNSNVTHGNDDWSQGSLEWEVFPQNMLDSLGMHSGNLCCVSTTSSLTVTECEIYTAPSGAQYTVSGIITDTIPNTALCDSIITIDLTINYPTNGIETVTACDSFIWIDGITYYMSNNTATFNLLNAVNCDSTVTLNLTINSTIAAISQTGSIGQILTASPVNATYTWIDCSTMTTIPTETNQTYEASADGSFAVVVTENGCSDTSECVVIAGLGLDVLTNSNVRLFPNPTNDFLSIESSLALNEASVRILSMDGKVFLENNKLDGTITVLNVHALSNGMYIVEIATENEVVRKQFVKQ